mgnify:CR=1 FL=1
MNLLDIIYPNPFLQSLFPQGLSNELLVGKVEFDSGGHSWLTIHTKQRTQTTVKKWGEYGKDYNRTAIRLSICNSKKVSVVEWFNADYLPVDIIKKDDKGCIFRQRGEVFYIEIEAEFFSFHSCDAYLNDEI